LDYLNSATVRYRDPFEAISGSQAEQALELLGLAQPKHNGPAAVASEALEDANVGT